jgi:two-component system OmpR family sensor kinase
VVEDLRRTAGGRLHLQLPSTEAVLTTIDPDAFAILLRNLIENAMKHGASDQPIEVSLSSTALLQVVNAGPLVPPALLAQLSERFVRGPGQTEGSGLGLAIAAAIAQGVGARLLLASPAPGQADGFAVSVQFVPA